MSEYLKFEKICMEFPGVKALDDMSFGVNKGEIVAFLGENGAGKSTLLKILNGDYHHTSGKVYIDGKEVEFHSPNEAIKAGISVIYQERQLAPYLSVAENIFMGNPPTKNGFIDFKELNKKAKEIIDEFGLPITPETPVKKISVAFQQMVEIMKAYNRKADIICFDEPTAPLTDSEIVILFQIINKLKAQGKAIIYVSHRMNEIFEITDRVVVFKDGKLMGVENTGDVTEAQLIKMMVGRDIGDVFNDLKRNDKIGDVVLEMKNVSNSSIKDISLQVKAGEIVGFSGLAGAGRTEVARAIFGADPITSGEITLKGKPYHPKSPRDAMDRGIALCPEDRKLEGLSLILTVRENSSLAILGNLCKAGFVNFKQERDFTSKAIKEFNIKTPTMEQKVNNLSGGNQQKIVLARWMAMNPQLIIFDEPTKGIDVGAKSEIYHMICEAARKGVAVIMISSELPEVIGISDRILVMKDGKIKADIPRKDATEQLILSYAMLDEKENEKEAAV
ncbi:ribose transport system ATP-binding protein/L-arabinose transport system ATP-binding protein [Hydrogenoanaerobacterium saccharovorans]|uniref:Ribose transport system ATP-binding protein/L-arabinose transport system ATP-binding protein n=1 Tax=Hydrogenoanaerobacterium saccharovorans TaxID=474960 RepID=A0A1H8BQU3_9FIRM|nr:sugar ABC transporter ATP-binding protein [Hydrogenoanaerobacterium saccharovorans]RPF47279.1 ribose transport system ATP-binding protein/L-arabinose transport system ATP-binding protein [Hydrogenoanaerobacterium saccharovorans]SEM85251.1 ribose transport system ATP-binding protein/L-arabinose transport system ATP-binding protein [Hydrogenoanaerobacterium saccharovorans]